MDIEAQLDGEGRAAADELFEPSDAINGLRRIGLWKDEIDFADLKARMMELQRLTDASTPGPFECRNASAARQWARVPSERREIRLAVPFPSRAAVSARCRSSTRCSTTTA